MCTNTEVIQTNKENRSTKQQAKKSFVGDGSAMSCKVDRTLSTTATIPRTTSDGMKPDTTETLSDNSGSNVNNQSTPPSSNETLEPHDNDVLSGRGGSINVHPGNEKFRRLVEQRKRVYLSSRFKLEKRLVASSIVSDIRNQDPPGRFLSWNGRVGVWCEIGDKKARDKTCQALRERGPTIRAEMEAEKAARREEETRRRIQKEEEADAAAAAAEAHYKHQYYSSRRSRINWGQHPNQHYSYRPGMDYPGEYYPEHVGRWSSSPSLNYPMHVDDSTSQQRRLGPRGNYAENVPTQPSLFCLPAEEESLEEEERKAAVLSSPSSLERSSPRYVGHAPYPPPQQQRGMSAYFFPTEETSRKRSEHLKYRYCPPSRFGDVGGGRRWGVQHKSAEDERRRRSTLSRSRHNNLRPYSQIQQDVRMEDDHSHSPISPTGNPLSPRCEVTTPRFEQSVQQQPPSSPSGSYYDPHRGQSSPRRRPANQPQQHQVPPSYYTTNYLCCWEAQDNNDDEEGDNNGNSGERFHIFGTLYKLQSMAGFSSSSGGGNMSPRGGCPCGKMGC